MKRTVKMKAVSDRRRKRDATYPKARKLVYERAEGMCEVMAAIYCTGRCEQIHHLAGRAGPEPHRLGNLIGCCADCHALIHNAPEWARDHGLMISRLGGAA